MRHLSAFLISDFNLGNFSRYLENDGESPSVTVSSAPFGQVISPLLEARSTDSRPHFAVIWSSPEHISPTFARLLESDDCDFEAILFEVDEFCSAVRSFCRDVDLAFVPTWVPTLERSGSFLLGMRSPLGTSRVLLEMNLRLAENLHSSANVYLLDSTRWMEIANARDPKLWYLAKVPFANEVFLAAVRDIKSCLRGIWGEARKIILLDLDDTLWGGLVGDVGWEKLRLGGHDAVGEAYVDFQRALKALTRRGVILGIISKNEAHIALEAIDRHPEMVLRRENFAGWRINREDKARNLVELVDELNLGLNSVVFIDDSAVERARVRETLPEVLVPEWPSDCLLFPRALAALKCFEVSAVTPEDAMRTKMYVAERSRVELLERIGSVDSWLKSLAIRVEVQEVGNGNLDRALQLLNKTNQMNLATRRLNELEFQDWLATGARKSWCFRVSDRLGDSGIAGLLSIEQAGELAEIRDFLLSCRVMGRKVEETMLHVAIDYARSMGLQEVRAKFEPTPRNGPCLEFFKRAGFPAREGENVFIWYAKDDYPVPEAVECSKKVGREVNQRGGGEDRLG
jgi:FkbH-like protein